MKNKFYLPFIFLFLFCYQFTFAQISFIKPQKPKEGDVLKIYYNPFAENSMFSINDSVFAIIWIEYQDGNYRQEWQVLKRKNNQFICSQLVNKNAAHYTFHFITLSSKSYDYNAAVSTMIYRNDGIPVRNACHKSMDMNTFHEDFNNELRHYPNNYSVYRDKWFYFSWVHQDSLNILVTADIKKLQEIKVESVELFHSLSYGYLLVGDEEKSRDVIKKMIKKFPSQQLTFNALISYNYQIFTQHIKGKGPREIQELTEKLINQNPELPYSWKLLSNNDSKYSNSTIENICKHWCKVENNNPIPHNLLAKILKNNNSNLDEALEFINKSIDLTIAGKYRLYKDISGKMNDEFLGLSYKIQADIYYKQKEFAKALSSIKTSQSLIIFNIAEPYITEGKIWFDLANYKLAEKAFLEAWNKGDNEAKNYLLSVYNKTHNVPDDFEKYFNGLTKKVAAKKDSSKIAPDFDVVSLKKEKLKLSELKGKIVVLNFWFTGCGPCKVEIPELNKLVDKYKDVVFIAFSLDEEKRLKSFLKKTIFNYHVIPESDKIAKDYQISLYPSHIIINQKSEIYYKSIGGGKNIGKELSLMVERLR
jgi:thiol-disulfide isomerase/thioredoxin